jgi:hypothetical protein
MKMLYKYPQGEFPYTKLVTENSRRGLSELEYELADTGIFEASRYFDVLVEYVKADQDDILIQITSTSRGPDSADCYVLAILWFRNTWSWGYDAGPMGDVLEKPGPQQIDGEPGLSKDEKRIQRQALAGMLWTKQFYYYNIEQWLTGDPGMFKPPEPRAEERKQDWEHLNNFDIISMPDKWEYPWYAGWDLGFHCIPLALVDADFSKRQLELMAREWYMHPNGQLPAYAWSFGDVNPPMHAWAAWRWVSILCSLRTR